MNTNIKIYILVSFAIVIIAFIVRLLNREQYPFNKVDSVVTNTEKVFLQVLLSIIPPNDFYILTKVRLADIVQVRKGTKDYVKHFNKIKSKHIDFVICDRVDFQPLLSIELDDPSHLKEEAKRRDYVKDKVLEASEIPILRIKTQKKYDKESILNEILDEIE
jgi:hypothetical protein